MPRRSAFLCLLIGAVCFAQEFRSSITGRVEDPQGAVIPGAKVLAVQTETGSRFETLASADGQYTLPFLPPGAYRVQVEAPGFKHYLRERIQVSVNERLPLDVNLELGQASETVTVNAEAAMLETATASTGQVINARQIENMPMNGRTPLVLAQLAFGVIPSSDPRFYRPFDNAGPSGFSMGGAPGQSNELLVNGAPDTTGNSRVAYNPPVDAVQEIKVETFQADAAYGHTGGGTVNVVLKAGTNQLHGTAYEFNQTSALESTNFFLNRAGQKLPVGRYNQYGINSGGPIFLPKIYDGRNRLFWFFAYEGIRDSYPETPTITVPTLAERNGDFSELLKLGANYQIFDPRTGVVEGSRIRRQPFPNNIIPQNLINPIAKAYLQFYPLPNQRGGADGKNNFVANTVRSDTFGSEMGRLDWNISDRHKIFGDFRFNDRTENRGNRFYNIATGNFLTRTNYGSTIDDVYTFTPTTLLNTRLNWTRFIEGNTRSSNGFDFTQLGFPSYLLTSSPRRVLPVVDIGGFQQLGDSGGDRTPFDIFQIFTSLTKITGNHNLKAGADLRLYRESSIGYGNSSGSYTFRTNWTRGPLDNATAAPLGQDFAAFLMGLPTGGGFDLSSARTNQAGYYALFVQDDYRVKQNLTLNLGLRYERDLATKERYNRSANGFDFVTPNPVAGTAQSAYARNPIPEIPASAFKAPGGLVFASPSNPEIYRTQDHYFSPRFGFAWTPGGSGHKTVIRGGTGVFFFALGTGGVSNFGRTSPLVATLNSYLTPFATLSDPFPNGIQQPTGSSLGLATFVGQSVSFRNPNPLNPYSFRWTLDVQRQLSRDVVFEIGYVGNHSVHLTLDRQLNYVPRQYYSTSPVRDQAVIDRNTANVTNPFSGIAPNTNLDGSTIQRQQLLKPFPEFTGVTEQGLNDGSSYFHMLQTRLEKRFSHGLQLLGNFSYSRLMEKRSRLNDSDPYLEKRVSGDDRPMRFVVSGSYELPFSKRGFVGKLAGGWVLNAIYQIQNGAPLTWGNLIYYGGPLNYDARNVDRAFDKTRFNTNSREQLDWNIRKFPSRFNNLRADGPNNLDASLIKNTAIGERINLQFRVEFFNALNHPEFNGPNLDASSSDFGRITSQANDIGRVGQLGLRLVW